MAMYSLEEGEVQNRWRISGSKRQCGYRCRSTTKIPGNTSFARSAHTSVRDWRCTGTRTRPMGMGRCSAAQRHVVLAATASRGHKGVALQHRQPATLKNDKGLTCPDSGPLTKGLHLLELIGWVAVMIDRDKLRPRRTVPWTVRYCSLDNGPDNVFGQLGKVLPLSSSSSRLLKKASD
jgi:hypothetical protein